jgi:hypothetical protein
LAVCPSSLKFNNFAVIPFAVADPAAPADTTVTAAVAVAVPVAATDWVAVAAGVIEGINETVGEGTWGCEVGEQAFKPITRARSKEHLTIRRIFSSYSTVPENPPTAGFSGTDLLIRRCDH